MTLRRTLAGTVGALALMSAVAMPALAPPPTPASTNVAIQITSTGVLSVAVTETVPFGGLNYSFTNQYSDGRLTVTVTDLRGTAAGWTFNLRASGDFIGAHTNDTIPVYGLGVFFNYLTPVAGNPNVLPITGSSVVHVSTVGQQIVTAPAGTGNGEYDVNYLTELLVPGDTLVDTYTTTLTVEVPSAP